MKPTIKSPYAKALRSSRLFHKRITRNRKVYTRKGRAVKAEG